jgi:phosphohistidine phosphatase
MRTLMLLRHAKSSWSDPGLADVDRPLSPRGERAARRIAEYLRRNGIRPSLVLCSPARRTRQTLDAIEPALGTTCAVELAPELYGASAETLLERLRAVPDSADSVLLIGHNPGLEELALMLAERGAELPRLREKFPTAALATIVVRHDSWEALGPGCGELVDYVVPRELA